MKRKARASQIRILHFTLKAKHKGPGYRYSKKTKELNSAKFNTDIFKRGNIRIIVNIC